MAKDILTDLREGLQEMTKEEMQRVIEAVEAEKIPPLPMTPLKVMKKVYEIARHHQMTAEEFAILLEFQGDCDRELASRGVALSTALSMATVPLMLMLLPA